MAPGMDEPEHGGLLVMVGCQSRLQESFPRLARGLNNDVEIIFCAE